MAVIKQIYRWYNYRCGLKPVFQSYNSERSGLVASGSGPGWNSCSRRSLEQQGLNWADDDWFVRDDALNAAWPSTCKRRRRRSRGSQAKQSRVGGACCGGVLQADWGGVSVWEWPDCHRGRIRLILCIAHAGIWRRPRQQLLHRKGKYYFIALEKKKN